jgi:molybdopterin converting factor small subunit
VTVEFLGVARLRAGRPSIRVEAETLRTALQAVAQRIPALADLLGPTGQVDSRYLVSLGGRQFATDLDHSLRDGDCVLLLGADSGG